MISLDYIFLPIFGFYRGQKVCEEKDENEG